MTQAAVQERPAGAVPQSPSSKVIATRFGPIPAPPERVLTFPSGLLGFGACTRYVLSELPGRRLPYKLLQAVDDGELGFLVLPLDVDGGLIAAGDLEAAAETLLIEAASLAVLAIVTLRAEPDGLACTVNLKAPLLIDTARRRGWQYVLPSEAYDIRHPLTSELSHGR